MLLFLDGVLTTLFLAVAVFFVRYWRGSGDRLYAMFSLSFLVLAVNRLFLAQSRGVSPLQEHQVMLYVIRLAAFALILLAILDKNRRHRSETIPR